MIDEDDCGAIGGMKIGRGNQITRRKPASKYIHTYFKKIKLRSQNTGFPFNWFVYYSWPLINIRLHCLDNLDLRTVCIACRQFHCASLDN
jgi:hypothetical protein